MKIIEALAHLDPKNDEHWTVDGSPRLSEVSKLAQREVKRHEVIDAAPRFNRYDMELDVPTVAPAVTEPVTIEATKLKEEKEHGRQTTPTPASGERSSGTSTPTTESVKFERQYKSQPGEITQQRMDDIRAEILEIDNELAALQNRRAKLAYENNILGPRLEKMIAEKEGPRQARLIRDYLNSQQRIREEKINKARAFIEAGTSAKDVGKALNPRAPIDQAMQRKNARGTARPVRSTQV